jgi:hypothetical protein
LLLNAKTFQDNLVAKTLLLIEISSNKIVAYVSLLADIVVLRTDEKPGGLPAKFGDSFGALKIHMLAADRVFCEKYSHITEFLVNIVQGIAMHLNEEHIACRFITLDADFDTGNPQITEIYKSIGFVVHASRIADMESLTPMLLDLYT